MYRKYFIYRILILNSVLVEGVAIYYQCFFSNDTLLIIYNGLFLKLWLDDVLQVFLLFFLVFRQLESQISQIDQIRFDQFCDKNSS